MTTVSCWNGAAPSSPNRRTDYPCRRVRSARIEPLVGDLLLGRPGTQGNEGVTDRSDVSGGACVWLTGLSGSGKTTTALRMRDVIEQAGGVVTVLDGDVIRQQFCPGLGFGKADRDRNVLAVAWIAAEIVRHQGIVICSLISPYRSTRDQARAIVGRDRYIEVFVDAPLEVCETRDVKGLYERARGGEIAAMTGIADPYEPPTNPAVRLDSVGRSVDQNVTEILGVLRERGVLRGAVAARVDGQPSRGPIDHGAG
jgi:adenylyl-sulfate kinase